MSDLKPISVGSRRGAGCLIVFFSLFAIVGLSVFSFQFVPAAFHVMQARSWVVVPARIISSRVVSQRDEHSRTYSVSVSFEYTFAGQRYRSDRYQFLQSGSSSPASANKIFAMLRPGTYVRTYVNPNHPSEAVIHREWTDDMWLPLLLSLVFMSVGILPPVFIFRNRRKVWSGLPTPIKANSAIGGEVVLKPRLGPLGTLLQAVFLALFWNGITSLFVFEFFSTWLRGNRQYFLGIFLIPFVLVGLLLIGNVVAKFLAMFNPRAQLRVTTRDLFPGGSAELHWQSQGRYDRVGRLRIHLEGREEAVHADGKNSVTSKNIFARMDLVDSTKPMDIQHGKARFSLPANTMHTFTGKNNKIIWAFQLHGEISGWPDLKEEFPIDVHPQGRPA